MEYINLGSTNHKISRVCLGTMTFGKQNTQADADEQIAYALDKGINCMDTAEMYAVPPTAETYGKTEEIIGNWLSRNKNKREQISIWSKIAGKGMSYVRGGDKILGKYIESSIDESLRRLQTDYIDLYQLHWPNRTNPHFNQHALGEIDFSTVNVQQEETEILAVLQALDKCVKAGKIKFCGLSNETSWGIAKYLQLADKHNLPKMVSTQNEFSLIQTKDWPYVIESCQHNKLAYLAWSPLGGGALSGKYLNGQMPEGTRWALGSRHGNFRNTKQVNASVATYKEIAEKHGMTASQLSLAWCYQFKWVDSTIIGATSMKQLKENMAAFEKPLSEEIISEISEVQKTYPIPY